MYTFSWKVPVILVCFSRKLNFLNRFSKNTQMANSMKISPVGSELFHADRRTDGWKDRQTDRTKSIGAFHNFANWPKETEFAQPKSLHTSLWRMNDTRCQAGHCPQFCTVIESTDIYPRAHICLRSPDILVSPVTGYGNYCGVVIRVYTKIGVSPLLTTSRPT